MLQHFSVTEVTELHPIAAQAAAALEGGQILLFPEIPFPLTNAEQVLVARGQAAGAAKNISFDSGTGALRGVAAALPERDLLAGMLGRFGDFAEALVLAIAPGYGPGLRRGRASFRPVEIAGRESSWRKDDTRRHVDAFPSTPTQGRRLLRVFTNVDQGGVPRRWRVGPDFESYARAFLPRVSGRLLPGAAGLMALTGITKTRRSLYDQTMLGLHDAAKRDMVWQDNAPAEEVDFWPGQVWMVFTDQIPHAAVSGRNALEQTFYVEPGVLGTPEQAPLAVLSRLRGRDMGKVLF